MFKARIPFFKIMTTSEFVSEIYRNKDLESTIDYVIKEKQKGKMNQVMVQLDYLTPVKMIENLLNVRVKRFNMNSKTCLIYLKPKTDAQT